MVILATISVVLSGVVWAGVRAFDEGAEAARLHNEASVALERLARDLRAIPLDGSGAPDINAVTAGSITWDGSTRSLATDGDRLVLTVDGRSGVLLNDLQAFSIRAYDEADAALAETLSGAAAAPVRRLALSITASRGRASTTVRTKIFLRCMTLEGER